jgi:hypothetical protein
VVGHFSSSVWVLANLWSTDLTHQFQALPDLDPARPSLGIFGDPQG